MQDKWEVEQKFKVDDAPLLRQRLLAAGFIALAPQRHSDVYFRHPCRDLKATDEAFRLRTLDDSSCLTYKGKRLPGTVKTRHEIELDIGHEQREEWLQMLVNLGFEPLPAVVKLRETYAVDSKSARKLTSEASFADLHVTIDQVEQLGTYAEIELVVCDKEMLELASTEIQRVGDLLGLSQTESRSYLSMMLAQAQNE